MQSVLDEATIVLESFIPAESALILQLRTLCERLRHERLQLAVLGQFKRGKSTFLNALLSAPLLPMAVIPHRLALAAACSRRLQG
jgi:predicted GTPase